MNVGYVRVVDIVPQASLPGLIGHEFIQGNLCDPVVCRKVLRGVDTVFHFAATMGGMGTIHSDNDFIIYRENHTMTLNLLEASVAANVKRFLYASSACVYPTQLQNDTTSDVSLKELDVWENPPPSPQGLYGLEKLNSELLVLQFNNKMNIRIARFHNVFGPGGAWHNGREKAPAAFLRKAIALKLLGSGHPFELWGDGTQRRSFLWVEDAIDGVLKLMGSDYSSPVNIGSDNSVSTRELATVALQVAGVEPNTISFTFDESKPIGVASRNSNNDTATRVLSWKAQTSLYDAMNRTGVWIEEQIDGLVGTVHGGTREQVLRQLTTSKVLNLSSQTITFGILLPITSKGTLSPEICLVNLRLFAQSLIRTTWRDVHSIGGTGFGLKVYLAIDSDDTFLLGSAECLNKAESVLEGEGMLGSKSLVCDYPPGYVCKLWKDCAKTAWEEGCDYMVLMGDDVVLHDEGWMRDAHQEFTELSSKEGVPLGFGCVAFTDVSFPGMPTFPIVHRTHMDIFEGQVIPDIFINQDGDPFLFQLYRRWGCSRMFSSRISNSVGGESSARYTKQHASDWTFETLDDAVSTVRGWLKGQSQQVEQKLTLDIVIPCYRVNLAALETILALKASKTCSTMFIIIIDNPSSPHIAELNAKYAHRPEVRIRINKENLGASASRNRGMQESSADWVHFLDDDIHPRSDLLVEAEKVIRAHPKAAGFVGNALFPTADSVFTTAVHLAGVTFFWDIANKIDSDVPWGVTANLIARRNVQDGVSYDTVYPKTGGGEDIDFCRRKRAYSITNGGEGFVAAPNVVVTHPWWNDGKRSYWRFYMWSFGDGALINRFPPNSYRDFTPNAAELCVGTCGFGMLSMCIGRWDLLGLCMGGFISTILANVIHDCYRHLWVHPERDRSFNVDVRMRGNGGLWFLAVVEGCFIRIFSELGRFRGILARREFGSIGKRFDWFCGRWKGPVEEERNAGVERFLLAVLIFAMMCYH